MRNFVRFLAVAGIAPFFAWQAEAATIGVAVDSLGTPVAAAATINDTSDTVDERAALVTYAGLGGPDDVIGYFIPLSGGPCTFGEGGCGTSSDSGSGTSSPMTMYIRFSSVAAGKAGMTIWFEDLDLPGMHDPWFFHEFVKVYDEDGNEITPLGITGDAVTSQTMTLDLGFVAAGDYTASLEFWSSSLKSGRNTAEFLLAAVDVEPIPLPASLPALAIGLAGLGLLRSRRRSS